MRSGLMVVVVAAMLLAAPPADAAVTASAGNGVVNDDGSATVPVTVTCPPGTVVLEAHLGLSQDSGASGMGGIAGVRCNGRPRTYLATVTSFSGPFQPGSAHASPFVLVQSRRDDSTQSGGTSGTITLV